MNTLILYGLIQSCVFIGVFIEKGKPMLLALSIISAFCFLLVVSVGFEL